MKIETVEINRNGVKLIINKSDFDPKNDTLFVIKASPVKKTPAKKAK